MVLQQRNNTHHDRTVSYPEPGEFNKDDIDICKCTVYPSSCSWYVYFHLFFCKNSFKWEVTRILNILNINLTVKFEKSIGKKWLTNHHRAHNHKKVDIVVN